jgi:hypothetical protein
MDPRYRRAFERRVRQMVQEPGQAPFEAWLARPEDVILGKLIAWAEGRSYRHEEDIYSMLVFIYLDADPELSRSFDEADVDAQAATLGPEVNQLWGHLKEAARRETNGAL